jgi:hypothetical protein
LYTTTVTEQKGEGLRRSFGKKWGGYQALYTLAKGDVSRIDEVAGLPFHQCLMYLEYEKEKNDLENKLMKLSMK